MYEHYDLGSLVRQRQGEALREAQARRLAYQARPYGTRRRGSRRAGSAAGGIERTTPVGLAALLAPVAALFGRYAPGVAAPRRARGSAGVASKGTRRPDQHRFLDPVSGRDNDERGKVHFLPTPREKGAETP